MSKKRNRSLKALIDQQLLTAAEHIYRLLTARGPPGELAPLRERVTERISEAVENIFTAYGATRAARGEPGNPGGELCVSVGVSDCLPGPSSWRPSSPDIDEDEEQMEDEDSSLRCRVCDKSFDKIGFLLKHTETHLKQCVCGLCGEHTHSSSALKVHLQTHRDSVRTCDVCGRKFPSIRARDTHRRLHTGEKPFSCFVCDKGFNTKGSMAAHLRTHTAEKPFCCDVCNKDFSGAESLERHMKSHDGHAPFTCTECGRGFSKSSELRKHTCSSHDDNDTPAIDTNAAPPKRRRKASSLTPSHCCLVCGSAFRNKGNFVRHAETHLKEEELKCGVCGETSESTESLTLHIQGHRETSRMCDVCGISFRDMEIHMRTHTGQKPFSCTDCGKDFPRKGSLERHLKLHAGERPYICEFCGKTFIENTVLKRHIKTHTGGKPRVFSCDVCGKKFTMSQHLDVHKRIHTGEKPYDCRVCAKAFRQIGNLDSHMRTHTGEKPFICSLCGKRFRQKISLETHERFHKKDKPFSCQLCSKGFVQKIDLKRHMLTHTGEKPYGCSVCGKRYQEKRSVDAHMKVHTGEQVAKETEITPNVNVTNLNVTNRKEGGNPDFIQL